MTRYRAPAGAAFWTGSARIFAGDGIDRLGLGAFPFWPGEQGRRPDPTPMKQFRAVRLPPSLLRIGQFGRGVEAQSAQTTIESRHNNQSPNKAMEPTPVNVTVPANAGPAPFTSAAHLGR